MWIMNEPGATSCVSLIQWTFKRKFSFLVRRSLLYTALAIIIRYVTDLFGEIKKWIILGRNETHVNDWLFVFLWHLLPCISCSYSSRRCMNHYVWCCCWLLAVLGWLSCLTLSTAVWVSFHVLEMKIAVQEMTAASRIHRLDSSLPCLLFTPERAYK